MKQNWISVTDALPELEQSVLACTAGDDEPELLKYSNIEAREHRGRKERFCEPGFCRDLDVEDFAAPEREFRRDVTHWMPLPKPPEN